MLYVDVYDDGPSCTRAFTQNARSVTSCQRSEPLCCDHLPAHERSVRRRRSHELIVRPVCCDAAARKEEDGVGVAHRRKAVRDNDDRAAGEQAVEGLLWAAE